MAYPELMTFANPAAGSDFSTTVPAGQAWRVWGGSCHVVGSATNTNRTPTLVLSSGNTVIYVSSQGLDYQANANQTVVFFQETARQEGPAYLTGAGETWSLATSPASLVYNPVGIRAIWLPAGCTIRYFMFNMQVGDQMSQVGMLVETVIP